MENLNVSLSSISINKIFEDLEQNTRKTILTFDNLSSGEKVSVSLAQTIIERAKNLIVEHPYTKIVELSHKLNKKKFNYDSLEKELIAHVKTYTKTYLEQKPDAELLCEYITLSNSVGEKVRVFDSNDSLCLEIYKLREFKKNNKAVDAVKAVAIETDTKNLTLAFEQAKLIRREKNIRQSEIANFLGCSSGTISRIETGVQKGDKEIIQGYIHYVTYKGVFIECNLDKRRKRDN